MDDRIDLRFPVVTISGGIVLSCSKEEAERALFYCRASRKMRHAGWVVDSEGRSYCLSDPEPVHRDRPVIWFLRRLFGQRIPIRYRSIQAGERLSLDGLKAKVLAALELDRCQWEATMSLPAWERALQECKSYKQLIEMFF